MLKSALLQKLNSGSPIKKNNSKKKKITGRKISVELKSLATSTLTTTKFDFDDEIQELGQKFRIDPNNVKKAVEGLVKFTLENPKLKNKLFEDEQFPIYVQINSVKVQSSHSQICRIPLKHSLLTPDSDVCLIVADVKGIPNKSHEQHLQHYEKLLCQKGVNSIKKIMTFHEFRTEYETFELRNRLVELYDAFLADGKVSGKVVKKCGKIFYKKRKVPTTVKLNVTKLKDHVEQTLKKTPLYLHMKGDSFVVQIGHSKMKTEEVVENAFYVFSGIEKHFPGGFANVRSLQMFAHRGITIPLYETFRNGSQVQ